MKKIKEGVLIAQNRNAYSFCEPEMVNEGNFIGGTLTRESFKSEYLPIKSIVPKNLGAASV